MKILAILLMGLFLFANNAGFPREVWQYQTENTRSGNDRTVLLDFPNTFSTASAPVRLTAYPAHAVYCDVITSGGGVSASRLDLKNGELSFTYTPAAGDAADSIKLEFYDEFRRRVAEATVVAEYDAGLNAYILTEVGARRSYG